MNELIGEIKNSKNETLEYEFHQGSTRDRNLLIIGHGLGGNMNRLVVRNLALAASSEGLSVLRFSFSGNGGSGGLFEDCTLNKQVEDLKIIVTRMMELGWKPIYAGHGLGSTVGSLFAASSPGLRLLISIAGVVETEKFFSREFSGISADEGCMWEDPEYPLSSSFALDMKKVRSTLTFAANIELPWLLVHGTADLLVPLEDSLSISKDFAEQRKLVEIPEADHVFSEGYMDQMIEVVLEWIATQISESLKN